MGVHGGVFIWDLFSRQGRGVLLGTAEMRGPNATANPLKQGYPRNGPSTAKTSSGGRPMAAARPLS